MTISCRSLQFYDEMSGHVTTCGLAYLIVGPRTRLGSRYTKQLPTTMDAEAQKAKFAIHQACRDGQSMLI
jgi:hypothetical protein